MTLSVAPKTGTRGAFETRDRPHADENTASAERMADRARMPKTLGQLLTWYSRLWDEEVPERLHTGEVWNGRQQFRTIEVDGKKRVVDVWPGVLVGGSALGSHADTSLFRRYMESYAAETDEDGYYVRPCHAALGRLATRDHWMARNLFALAQAGYDWRSVADRGGWVHGMYAVYIEEALRRLWREYADRAVRLQ